MQMSLYMCLNVCALKKDEYEQEKEQIRKMESQTNKR